MLFVTIAIILIAYRAVPASLSMRNPDQVGPKTEQVNTEKYRQIFYVSLKAGSDQKGDGTKSNPWQTLVHALLSIDGLPQSSPCAVFVAAGVYDQGTIIMKPSVDLYGGFDPGTWQRDIHKFPTSLDGEGVRRVVFGADQAKIDGFTICHGLGDTHGGGILCDDTSPEITNNFIVDNLVTEPADFNHARIHQDGHHGGGIACLYNAVPVIKNNLFRGNRTAIGNGGAIAFYGWVRLKDAPETSVENSRMTGGLQAVLENNVFIGNSAGINDLSRTRSSNGGAVSCAFEARPLIRNNLIIGNQARGRGDAGGIYCEYFSYPLIEGNWIIGNSGDDDGGGIYVMKQSHPLIKDNFIAGNWTLGGGVGGIRLSKEGRAGIVQNLIIENPGGGVSCVDAYMLLEDNLILKNINARGVSYSNVFSYMQPSMIRNNIIRENEKGALVILKNAGSPPQIENNNMDIANGLDSNQYFDRDPGFVSDVLDGVVSEIIFDTATFQSRIKIKEPLSANKNLAGRVVRIGGNWGVITEYTEQTLTVWGNIFTAEKQDMTFEILSSYSRP
jgi:hypothetical protein